MKTLKLCIFSLLAVALCVGAGTVDNVTRGKQLRIQKASKCWGKIRVTDANPDFRVRITDTFPDLNVLITNFPSKVGEWRIVDAHEDYSVQFVSACEDFSIIFSPFPGLNQ